MLLSVSLSLSLSRCVWLPSTKKPLHWDGVGCWFTKKHWCRWLWCAWEPAHTQNNNNISPVVTPFATLSQWFIHYSNGKWKKGPLTLKMKNLHISFSGFYRLQLSFGTSLANIHWRLTYYTLLLPHQFFSARLEWKRSEGKSLNAILSAEAANCFVSNHHPVQFISIQSFTKYRLTILKCTTYLHDSQFPVNMLLVSVSSRSFSLPFLLTRTSHNQIMVTLFSSRCIQEANY